MNVKNVQKALNDQGFGPISTDGILGPQTTASIVAFQKARGIIPPDGLVGPITIDALIPPPTIDAHDLALRAMQIAISKNGVREATGNNDGPEVEKYLKSVGLGKGYAWCMAFVYYCYDRAAYELGMQNPLVKTAGCMRQWNEIGLRFHKAAPQKGDIFIMNLGGGNGHTGIVTKVYEGGSFDTIEGNTNTNGSANGDGVYLRNRRIGGKMQGYIRI